MRRDSAEAGVMTANPTRTRRTRPSRRLGVLGAVLALGLLAAACSPDAAAPPPGPGAPPDAITSTIFNRTNADRAANGLRTLGWNGQLAGLAGEWSHHMAATQQFRHRNLSAALDAPGFEGYAALGENILVGPNGIDGNAMHDAWMRSQSHHAVIMGNWDSMGIAYTVGGDGNLRAVANYGRWF